MSDVAGQQEDYADDAEEAPLLELDDVSVHFEDQSGFNPFSDPEVVYAVDDVSLEIQENDVVVLVGESGSGKTTLGKTAIGLQRPTDGAVNYRGQDIWAAKDGRGRIDIAYPEIRQSLQIVHQDPSSALNESMTVLETLSEPLRQWFDDLDIGGRRERIYNVLEQMNLTPPGDYAERYPHQLSGGEKQRVILTRALLMDPDLILADEAVSALDVSLRIETMDLMLDLQDVFDTSYLFISHNLSNARYLAEQADGRIGVMYLGRLVEIGTPEEIVRNPKHPYTKVLKWATPTLSLLDEEEGSPPVRAVDIPNATDPPSGCRFHTRCPFARETCTEEIPPLESADDGQPAACFRQYDDHPYWDSEWLDEEAARDARSRNI
jgi:peptide/nickel transport system ATP-binding protein